MSTTSDTVLGIRVPMATAIADAAAARRDYLDETGGRYVHLIADGEIRTSGDIAKALACGADAVMLGEPLSLAEEAPAGGAWWHSAASHPKLPRGVFGRRSHRWGVLEQLLYGPADQPYGTLNLFGGLRRAMAKCGYRDLKEFQKVGICCAADGPGMRGPDGAGCGLVGGTAAALAVIAGCTSPPPPHRSGRMSGARVKVRTPATLDPYFPDWATRLRGGALQLAVTYDPASKQLTGQVALSASARCHPAESSGSTWSA